MIKVTTEGGEAQIWAGERLRLLGISLSVCPSGNELTQWSPTSGQSQGEEAPGERSLHWSGPAVARGRFPQDRPVNRASLRLSPGRDGALIGRIEVESASPLGPERSVRLNFASLPGHSRFQASYLHKNWWTRPAFGDDLSSVPERTQCFFWQSADDAYGCLFPLVDEAFKAEVSSVHGALGIDVHTGDTGHRRFGGAAFALAFDLDPYRAIERAIRAGLDALGRPGRLRNEKSYPHALEYLGWCTWDAFYHQVNAEGILAKLREIQEKDLPFRWVLIDDGWFSLDEHGLCDFAPDPEKFPEGFATLVADLKEGGIDWVGLWHTQNAHWRGISPESHLAATHAEHLFHSKEGPLIPHPDQARAFPFWTAFHGWLRAQGFDMIKVDNQNVVPILTRDAFPVGKASKGSHHALQASAALHFQNAVINCMCMGTDAALHWVSTNVSRSSDDFVPDDEESVGEHALQNLYNSLWYGHLAWCDFDMWHTRHRHAHFHAALRAVSGGPVYVSDKVGETDAAVLKPLILEDGRVLRADHPPRVTRELLFCDPVREPKVLKVTNAVGDSGIIGCFHIHKSDVDLSYTVSPKELSELSQDEEQRYAVYGQAGDVRAVLLADQSLSGSLRQLEAHLYVVVPIRNGFASIGLKEKYLSPLTLTWSRYTWGYALHLRGGGSYLAWCEKRPERVAFGGAALDFTWHDGWLEIPVPGPGVVEVII